MQESVSHVIQNLAFSVKNLFQKQHSKVTKSTKSLKSITKSTAKAALPFIYQYAIAANFNRLVNQKHDYYVHEPMIHVFYIDQTCFTVRNYFKLQIIIKL